MADKKISALTASTTPLAGTEVLPIVQSGATVKVAVSDLTAGRAVSASSLTASTDNVIVNTTGKGITTGSAIPLGIGVNNTVNAITILTDNKVGIGVSPAYTLQVAFDAAVTAGGCNVLVTAQGGAFGTIGTTTNHALTLITNNVERVRVDTSGNVGIGATANASAILDVQSTTKGFRLPNMTTTQKNAISSPAAGLMVFDTTLAKACVYSGAAWQTITSI